MVVYRIRNKVNGLQYLGISAAREGSRWKQHLRFAQMPRPAQLIDKAIRKHGVENFTYEVIERIPLHHGISRLEEREVYWINKLKTFDRRYGYNLALGSYNNAGHTYSEAALRSKRNRGGKPVHQYSMDGVFIRTFLSFAEAERKTKVSRPNINSAVRGRRRQAGGFRWVSHFNQPKQQLAKHPQTKTRAKKVYCFTRAGEFICEYASAVEASKDTHAARSDISSAIKGKRRTAGGFVWSDKPTLSKKVLKSISRFRHKAKRRTAVVFYNAQGKRLKAFTKIGDAASYTGSSTTSVGQCARGEIEFVVTRKLGLCRFRLSAGAPKKLAAVENAPKSRTRSVACYDRNGKRIAIHPSLTEAAARHKTRTETIDQAIRLNIHAAGVRWRDHPASKLSPLRIGALADKTLVCQYDFHGKLVRTYSSVHAAAKGAKRSYTTASAAVEGGAYSMAGYFWRRFPADKIPIKIKTPPPRAKARVN